MDELLEAVEIETNFENFIAKCPHCGFRNIYNRVSDLQDIRPISRRGVTCLSPECRYPFDINGDTAAPVYQMLIFDCHNLLKEKRYIYCILNLTQACEIFFSLYARIQLIYRNYSAKEHNICKMNELLTLFHQKVKTYAFAKLRNLFINLVMLENMPRDLNESEDMLNAISEYTEEPSDRSIAQVEDHKMRDLLQRLKSSEINILRNKVIHKFAYRPSKEETENLFKETKNIIYLLAGLLNINADETNINSLLGNI